MNVLCCGKHETAKEGAAECAVQIADFATHQTHSVICIIRSTIQYIHMIPVSVPYGILYNTELTLGLATSVACTISLAVINYS